MKEIIGKKINKIEMQGDTILVFTDSENVQYVYETYGDCCSYSWFSNITGIQNLIGCIVNLVTEREEFTDFEQRKAESEYLKQNGSEPDALSLYGYSIKTKKGTCDIEFRNESNGYYGGECAFSGNKPYKKNGELKEINTDF